MTWWLELWRLSRRRLADEQAYYTFQVHQAHRILERLERLGCSLQGRRVLDLGCGVGGYSAALHQRGARVVALDLHSTFLLLRGIAEAVQADALRLPLRSASVEGVFCASLIEHVPDPLTLLQEIQRVVRPDGWIYLSFPPFYSPVGGHQFAPFHYLGERLAVSILRRRRWWGSSTWVPSRFQTAPASFAEAFGDYGLYPLTIRRARRLIQEAGLEIAWQGTRFLPLDLSRLPLLGELLTWHVEFVLRPRSERGLR